LGLKSACAQIVADAEPATVCAQIVADAELAVDVDKSLDGEIDVLLLY